jgi:hypothetical protein
MLIDCDSCRMRDIACSDCVVTLLLGTADASQDLDPVETAALGALAAGGLAPPLRLVPVWRPAAGDVGHVPRPGPVPTEKGENPPDREERRRRATGR